ncbi:MAG: hypothetical protein H0X29_07460 [Parachlamydiaceae bacterium]|nr:hypothetical protein [Parachlamydiaceae bacterium]
MFKLFAIFICFFNTLYIQGIENDDQSDFFTELLKNNQKRHPEQGDVAYLNSIDVYSALNSCAKELIRNEQIIWETDPLSGEYRMQIRIIRDIENQELCCHIYEYDEKGICKDILKQNGDYFGENTSTIQPYFEEIFQTPEFDEDEIIDETTHRCFAIKYFSNYIDDAAQLRQAAETTAANVIIMKYAALYEFEDFPSEKYSLPLEDEEMHILPFAHFPVKEEMTPKAASSYFEQAKESVENAYNAISEKAAEIQKNLSYSNYVKNEMDTALHQVFGQYFLKMTGYYQHDAESGEYGRKDEIDKVRITLINGILNIEKDLHLNLHKLSSSHGGAKIHYVYRPTKGWMWDLADCAKVKSGFISPQAHLLAKKWKELIQEMGGTEAGGKIFHYAHSIGGAETNAAKNLLTPQELRMIHVTTIGSPTIIPNEGFANVVNYVSKRDGVCLFDPLNYIGKQIYPDSYPNTNIVYLGTFLGVPLIEHPLANHSYESILNVLGEQFQEEYSRSTSSQSPISG